MLYFADFQITDACAASARARQVFKEASELHFELDDGDARRRNQLVLVHRLELLEVCVQLRERLRPVLRLNPVNDYV